MHQLTQKLKSGEMIIQDLPCPQVGRGMVLVRNQYSLVSAGTEGSTVKTARSSLLAKAKERPQQVRQVLEVLRKQGPVQTYRAVMKKLDAYSPLGYSSVGQVIAVGNDENLDGGRGDEFSEDGSLQNLPQSSSFQPPDSGLQPPASSSTKAELRVGDWVACAGAGYANHAEVVAVPFNLCVKLPEGADLKRAAYNTLGSIALQGIRQADLRLGESCAVIGLGLIGQLTCLMLRASGVRVAGIDVEAAAVATAAAHCADLALQRSAPGISDAIARFSGGIGVDAVVITAGTSSLDPINFAGEIARKKGRVVVVGAVPTGFERDPYYYRKELELRMSCSYGPGRYDPEYEEKGVDYPSAYVRWTEKRNMEAFQDLLHRGIIDVGYLTTHVLRLEDAPKAYDMILSRSEPFLGILIEYDATKPIENKRVIVGPSRPEGKIGLAFIGAGSYAQSNLLPNLPRNDSNVVCRGVMTNSGTTSKRVAEKFGFEFCTSIEADILGNKGINTVFIATRHDSHGSYVAKALRAGKHVFVEKPLALGLEELQSIEHLIHAGNGEARPQIMVGYNRRFAPLAIDLKRRLNAAPMSMVYRVNAGAIPADNWIQDKEVGGGRIIGEGCHFIDFMAFLCGANPVCVYATPFPDPQNLHDTVSITIEFADGSVGVLCYFANGSKALDKEYVEVYQSGLTAVMDDFRELRVFGRGKPERRKLMIQDKGQSAMIKAFLSGLTSGTGSPILFDQLRSVSLACFAAERSIIERAPVRIV